jgi:Cof subfamily protein (haloacid dehalogenase superfamily)
MTEYKVVFLDIDGTILRPDDTIEDSTKSAIKQLKDRGIEVILATGRPLHEIRDLGDELNIQSYIAYNGAYALYKGETIFNETMEKDDVNRFIQIAKHNQHDLVLYTNNKNYFLNLESERVKTFQKAFHLRRNDFYLPTVASEVLGITIITEEEDGDSPYHSIEEIHYSKVNVPGFTTCFDVIRDHVNKGVAVHAMLEQLAFKKEQAIAFGDGMNDKEMLSNVGEGFAMGSGNPELFSYAKHVTTGVTESGVFNGLKSLGLVK